MWRTPSAVARPWPSDARALARDGVTARPEVDEMTKAELAELADGMGLEVNSHQLKKVDRERHRETLLQVTSQDDREDHETMFGTKTNGRSVVFGLGYLAGTRAGRERYDQFQHVGHSSWSGSSASSSMTPRTTAHGPSPVRPGGARDDSDIRLGKP